MTSSRASDPRGRGCSVAWAFTAWLAAAASGSGAVWLLGAAACSGPQRPPDGDRTAGGEPAASTAGSPSPAQSTPAGSTPAADPRTPIERRRDAACEHLAPRITACAVEDARAKLGAGKIDQRQFDADTAAAIQRKHTDEFEKSCKAASYSSRQIRVLEVCFREETQCRPLLDCLGHLSDRVPASGRGG